MPRDVSLSDSKCWNSGQKWVKHHLVPGVGAYEEEEIRLLYAYEGGVEEVRGAQVRAGARVREHLWSFLKFKFLLSHKM